MALAVPAPTRQSAPAARLVADILEVLKNSILMERTPAVSETQPTQKHRIGQRALRVNAVS
jgi:hypothetical protein